MSFLRSSFAAILAATVAFAAAAEPASTTSTQSTSSTQLPSSLELKEGDTRDDPKTSHAVEQILARCAAQYAHAEAMKASGTYIQASKSSRRGETVSSLHLDLLFQAPGKLRIDQEGEDLHTVFLADGSTVTQVNHSAREFVALAQPDDLSAFTEEERDGELADDETNGIANSVIASLLLTPDPLKWLHANVKQYVYEGVEDVTLTDARTSGTRRVSCWRIKFVQENPSLVVVNWIDRQTFLFRKVSIIQAVDSDGDFTQSYQSASTARMRITIFEEVTTGPKALDEAKFSVKIPKGYTPLTEAGEESEVAGDDRGEGGWTRLVRAAIAEKGERTTATIAGYYGPDFLAVRPFQALDSRITALASGGAAFGGPSLLVGTSGKQLGVVKDEGTTPSLFSVTDGVDQVQPLTVPSGNPLLVAGQIDSGKVRAFTAAGKTAWVYDHGTNIASIGTSRGALPGKVYVAYENNRGLRVLDNDGKVLHASRRFVSPDSVIVAHQPGASIEVLAHSAAEMAVFDGNLALKHRFDSDMLAGPSEIDVADAAYPIVMIRFSDADDAVLQRIGSDGETSWSLILAPDAADLKGAAVDFANLRLPVRDNATTSATKLGPPQRCIFTLLSDGRITIASLTGDLIYRGQLSAQGTLANRNDQWRTFGLAIQDFDGDGEDEIYTAIDAELVQIHVKKAEVQ